MLLQQDTLEHCRDLHAGCHKAAHVVLAHLLRRLRDLLRGALQSQLRQLDVGAKEEGGVFQSG
eukprot:3767635-Lingulodinium_polyedra.AAC.1